MSEQAPSGAPRPPATVSDLEALLFVVDRPIERREAAKLLEVDRKELDRLIAALRERLVDRGITLVVHNDELQLASGPAQARAVLAWVGTGGSDLTAAPLETLAIVAYRQPVTKAGIEEIRGVDADYALRLLLERGLIEEVDRLETPGRPHRYGTTLEFLRRFGLASLADLPALEGDADALRHLELKSEVAPPAVDGSLPSTPADEAAAADAPLDGESGAG
ncbi:MAG: SMC-Scp complex subunit ScpB [Chloroflexota bacterium]|jgi:segregation and condensation protein B